LAAALCGLGPVLTACGGGVPQPLYFPLPSQPLEVVRSEVQAFVVDTIFSGLERPFSLAFLPDNTVLITERRGEILVVRDGEVHATLAGSNVPEGLRDIVLHPRYAETGWIYLSYYVDPGEDSPARTVVMRARLRGDRLVDDEVIFTAGPFRDRGEYFGSRLAFDRDENLHILVGQRNKWGTPPDRGVARAYAQDLASPSGKTMRVRDDGSIPPDNPFVDIPGALPEIFTYGHREHQGLALHPVTGELWSTEHGEMGGTELNILRKGLNYGWPLATFSLNYDTTHIADPFGDGFEPPIHHWTPSLPPAMLDFVTGDRYPAWRGNVMIGTLRPEKLVRLVVEGERVVHEESLLEGIGRIRTVRMAPDGYLYLVTEDTGLLLRLVPVD
jgi:aldose sugar dehydrogenase